MAVKSPRTRWNLALIALVGVLVLAAVVVQSGGSSPPAVTVSPRPAASAFASGYLRYLSGAATADSLPATTARVRALAAQGGVIPPRSRQGVLTLSTLSVSAAQGAAFATARITGRDGGREVQADVKLRFADRRWSVVDLIPPDLGTLLATRPSVPAITPSLRAAAGRFVLAYADYMEQATSQAPSAGTTIAAQIKAGQDPLAGVTPTGTRAALVSLRFGPVHAGSVAATGVLSDRGRHTVTFVLTQATGRWLPWSFVQGIGG